LAATLVDQREDGMRRLCLLLLAVLVCAVAVAPAQARIQAQSATQDVADVKRYWTAERMRNAVPADLVRAGAGDTVRLRGPKKKRSAVEIPPPYTSQPTSTNGKVFFTDGGSNFVCSGTALLSGNSSTVWTAGHCVHDGASGFHTNWAFVPGYADGSRPFGTWAARSLFTTAGWAGGDLSFDLGAAVVSPQGGSELTEVVGGRNVIFNYNRNQRYQAHGYPAAPPFNGQRLWVCDSPLRFNDTSANPPTMGIDCDMTGGSSGGGWIAGSSVASVNSYGYRSLPGVLFGPYQGTVAQSLYTQAAGS
jgi:V8-like Glu-specific endopeptidase